MKLTAFSATGTFGRLSALLLPLLMVACSQTPHSALKQSQPVLAEPEIRMVDYLAVNCERIWQINDDDSMDNPLYWLRAIDCAARLSPAAARAEAKSWPANSWHNALKQGVLMDNGNVTPVERQTYMKQLDGFSMDYPLSIRPLIQLWRSNQAAQLDLSDVRTRYHHLQQTSDSELDGLRNRQAALKRELAVTRRKLETLTDIERQLSSRKSPDVSENSRSGERVDTPNAVPADETWSPAANPKTPSVKGKESDNEK
ncbi:two-component system QseEF-associated lipoprotein QseG [Paramixta manurensis]|uniref:Two-component system QseEF-associated lipoprotein QseG n=1 Tax=Paramixta manurensis TaxID=2740817 RepID=A0A6M8UIL0_9GAMM|nr:two-component system QseEF-associated lipoprotein QseG [Erwiniaceae bacterium PD-1]